MNGRFLLAVSGGLDSSVLCHLFATSNLSFSIAHCNFGLRGEESDRDEAFVRQLSVQYGVPLFVTRFNTAQYAAEQRLSVQESARALRYQWFAQLCKEEALDHTVLAHHADDSIETMLMHFFRGTGLQGLTGISERSQKPLSLLRPLTAFRRKELEEYAATCGLQWVEDSSNQSDKYTRNYFRNQLIPSLKKIFPQVEENLLDNMERFRKVNRFYQQSMETLKKGLIEVQTAGIRIPVLKLKKLGETPVLFEIIRDYGFTEKQVGEVEKLLEAPSGKYIRNTDWQIIRHRNWLIVAPLGSEAPTVTLDKEEKSVAFSGLLIGQERYTISKWTLDTDPGVAQLDASRIEYPLVVRKWKTGDYFYPLGLRKKKKVTRFLIDLKLSKDAKEKVWVVESKQRIIWVGGLRIDDRFKVTPATRQVLQLKIEHQSPR